MFWGQWLMATAVQGGWTSAYGPALLTWLLLRVSGVALLEKKLSRKPQYADYIARTNAFFPWFPRKPQQ
jgi:steroid 5-alpha reductase family enzyme